MNFKNRKDYFFKKGYLNIIPELFFAFGTGLFIPGFISKIHWATFLGFIFLVIFGILKGIVLSEESFESAMMESINNTLKKPKNRK